MDTKTVAVVGSGLVGSLEAIYLAKRGMEVHVYELRQDIRNMEHVPGKSINLAISVRGLSGLAGVGLDEHVKQEYGIPMHSRMIHRPDSSLNAIPYGKEGETIYSVGRRYVNEILLDEGAKYQNIHYHFYHKLIKANLEAPELTFERTDLAEGTEGKTVTVRPDLVIGCDGAYSAVRREMLKRPHFNYKQEYIPHAYLELCMPAIDDDFAMAPNYLHIWPRGQFMLIGLPNQDKTFTMTLFMPTETFAGLKDRDSLLNFFDEHFPDSIPLLGVDRLVSEYFSTKPAPLICVKCNPYNVGGTTLIMGDAAHATVPFYGQGMNCGMEDCVVLEEALDRNTDLESAITEFSSHRNPDAEAMVDLSLHNYIEMRDLVNKKSFLVRKKLDNFLHWLLPSWWVPLYTSVTFSRMRYHLCITNRAWQDSALGHISSLMGLASLVGVFFLARNQASHRALGHLLDRVLGYMPRLKLKLN